MNNQNSLPSSKADTESSSDEEGPQIPGILSQEELKKQLEALSISSEDIPPKRRQRAIGWVALIAVLALLALGILSARGFLPSLSFIWPPSADTTTDLVSTDGRYIVFIEKREKGSEVKLIDTITDQVQDISLGDTNARQAALSPDSTLVAYVSTNDDGSSLHLVSVTGGMTTTFSTSSLNAAASSTLEWEKTRVCEWSDIYWSPKLEHLAFFACSEGKSALLVVPSSEDAIPRVLEGTEASIDDVRNAVWLSDERIALITGEMEYNSIIAVDLTKQPPQRLYGPLD